MLPEGAVHVPFKGTAKIARTLRFDYAEAVTGFEFRKRRATPIITGVVVAAENESALLEAYWETERDAEEKRRVKKHEQVLKRWTRLIHGLRIRDRLKKQYAGGGASASPSKQNVEGDEMERKEEEQGREAFFEPGGYLTAVDDIIKPFTLPKYQHAAFQSAGPSRRSSAEPPNAGEDHNEGPATPNGAVSLTMETIGDEDADQEMEKVQVSEPVLSGVPKTMLELAEASVQQARDNARRGSLTPQAISSPALLANETQRRSSRTNSTRRTLSTTGNNTITLSGRRKRAREDPSDSDGDAVESPGEASPTKRARGRNGVPVASTTLAKSDRVLRTRKSKTTAELEAEREKELAYRRAIAE